MARHLQLNKYKTHSICKWKCSEDTSHELGVTAMILKSLIQGDVDMTENHSRIEGHLFLMQ